MFSVLQPCRTLAYGTPFAIDAKITCSSMQQLKFRYNRPTFPIMHFPEASFNSYHVATRSHTMVAFNAKEPDSGNEEPTARETVQKLYEAMRNRSVHEISDIIAEECLCISNFFSAFQPFHGKKQVMEFFCSLMKKLGDNIQFVVQHTVDDGMVVAVSWKLEWNKVPLPLGKGFSLYMCHVYMGKVMIKNVEIFLEPLLHLDPLRMKFITLAMRIMEKVNLWALFKHYKKRSRTTNLLFFILIVLLIVFLLKYWSCI